MYLYSDLTAFLLHTQQLLACSTGEPHALLFGLQAECYYDLGVPDSDEEIELGGYPSEMSAMTGDSASCLSAGSQLGPFSSTFAGQDQPSDEEDGNEGLSRLAPGLPPLQPPGSQPHYNVPTQLQAMSVEEGSLSTPQPQLQPLPHPQHPTQQLPLDHRTHRDPEQYQPHQQQQQGLQRQLSGPPQPVIDVRLAEPHVAVPGPHGSNRSQAGGNTIPLDAVDASVTPVSEASATAVSAAALVANGAQSKTICALRLKPASGRDVHVRDPGLILSSAAAPSTADTQPDGLRTAKCEAVASRPGGEGRSPLGSSVVGVVPAAPSTTAPLGAPAAPQLPPQMLATQDLTARTAGGNTSIPIMQQPPTGVLNPSRQLVSQDACGSPGPPSTSHPAEIDDPVVNPTTSVPVATQAFVSLTAASRNGARRSADSQALMASNIAVIPRQSQRTHAQIQNRPWK